MNNLKLDTMEQRDMLIYSFRYSLSRMSVAPHTMADIIRKNLNNISTPDLKLFAREIEEAHKDNMLGMEDIDVPMWLRLRDDIETELKKRG